MATIEKEYVTGLQGVLSQLDGIKKSLRNKHLKRATNEISRAILWGARSRVPRRLGTLYKSLGRKVKVYRGSGVAVAVVGARKGYKEQVAVRVKDSRPGTKYPKKAGDAVYADPVKYLHLVELGTVRTKAHHALRGAAKAARPMMADAVRAAVGAALAEAAAKGGGK